MRRLASLSSTCSPIFLALGTPAWAVAHLRPVHQDTGASFNAAGRRESGVGSGGSGRSQAHCSPGRSAILKTNKWQPADNRGE